MNKTQYTKIFLKELDESLSEENVKHHLFLWWQNTREKDEGGLRLTEEGLNALKKADIKVYTIPYPSEMPITAQVMIYLDRFIDCPYYLDKKSITVTNERKAVELTLFSGDIRKYGTNKALTRKRKEEK